MSWDDYAEGWDDDEGARAYAAAAFASLQAVVQKFDGGLSGVRVLDFGCGTGLLSTQLASAGAEVVALDPSEGMQAVLRAKVARQGLDRVHPVTGTLEALDAQVALGSRFTLVVCSSVCAFLDDYPQTAKALAARLEPGGWLVQWDWARDPNADEPFGLTREEIAIALKDAGLGEVSVDVGFRIEAAGKVMAPLMGMGRRLAG